jgi:hypothetical protein
LRIHALGQPPQRQITQGDQVAAAEEVFDGLRRLRRQIDLAFLQTRE